MDHFALRQIGILENVKSPTSLPLVRNCQFGLSPVNYSDSDSESTINTCDSFATRSSKLIAVSSGISHCHIHT